MSRFYPDEAWRQAGAVRLPLGGLLLTLAALGAWATSSGYLLLSGAAAAAVLILQATPWRHRLRRPVRLGLSLAAWALLVALRVLLDAPPRTLMWTISLVADVFALWLVLDLSRRMLRPELLLSYSCAVGLLVCSALNPDAAAFPIFAAAFVVGGLMETSGLGTAWLRRPAALGWLGAMLGLWAALAMSMPEAQRWYRTNLGAYLSDSAGIGSTGFGPDSRLGDIGLLRPSLRPVLRLKGPPPQRLIGAIHTRYLDGRWDNRSLERRRLLPHTRRDTLPLALEPGEPVYRLGHGSGVGVAWEALLTSGLDGVLFTPAGTVAVQTNLEELQSDSRGALLFPPQRSPVSYRVVATNASEGRPGPEDTALPPRIVPTLQTLLREIPGAGEISPAARADALTAWLRANFRYSLNPPRPGPAEEPILHFLTVGRRGYCEHFAGSLALLLRATGVPTRYVAGFAVSEEVPYGGYWLVRGRDAHAWVEVWTGERWTVWDPSPAAEQTALTRREPLSPLAQRLDALALLVDDLRARWTSQALVGLAAELGGWIAGLALLALVLRVRPWRAGVRLPRLHLRRQHLRGPLEKSLHLLDHALRTRGAPRPPHCTLLELPDRIRLPADAGERLRDLMERASAVRFGGGDEAALAREIEDFTRRELPRTLRTQPG